MTHPAPAVLVAGTGSDAGKTTLVAALCRLLVDRGIDVAPFKAQNMALNSAVASDGGEIGRAQALQAAAARIPATTAMNPILLKPSGDRTSHVVVDGRPLQETDAVAYGPLTTRLWPHVRRALADLRTRHELVVCEGAGGVAEPNLRDRDLVNMGLAADADLPVVVVGDIERGGVFASLYGSWALQPDEDRQRIRGFVINRFRGDASLLDPAIEDLTARTGVPVLGVVPWVDGLGLDAEDSLGLRDLDGGPPVGEEGLRIAVLRLQRISNFTDIGALGREPGVTVTFTESAAAVADADLVVIPGTRATVADLDRLRQLGLDRALRDRATAGGPILGICGGYQMLGRAITDTVEGGGGTVAGLGLLPVETTFDADKVVRRVSGDAPALGTDASGYEIRHGRTTVDAEAEVLVRDDDGRPGGVVAGPVMGTSWHGLADHDDTRRALLRWVAEQRGRRFVPGSVPAVAHREADLDRIAAVVADHVDVDGLLSLAGWRAVPSVGR